MHDLTSVEFLVDEGLFSGGDALTARGKCLCAGDCSLHVSALVSEDQVALESVLRPESSRDALDLLLSNLLRLGMQEVIELQLQVPPLLYSLFVVLLLDLLLGLADQGEVAVGVEEVVVLEEDDVLASGSLVVVELEDGLQVDSEVDS